MKKTSIVFLSIIFVIMNIFPSFAAVATPSTASVSNALPMEDYFETDGFDTLPFPDNSLFSDSSVRVTLIGVDNANNNYSVSGSLGTRLTLPALSSTYYTKLWVDYGLGSQSPSPGTYYVNFDMTDNLGNIRQTGVDNISADYYVLADSADFVEQITSDNLASKSTVVTKNNNNWSAAATIQFGYDSTIMAYHMDLYSDVQIKSVSMTVRDVRFEFTSNTPSIKPPSGTEDPNSQVADNTGEIANNTAQIVEGQDNIMDTIREQVQYITLQLEAFWNQLSGEFTNLFNKMNDQLSSLLSGITEQTEEIVEHLGDVQTEIDQSTTEINNNIDQSTDQITNGYDNSGLNQAANNYHEADKNLENAQDEAWNQGADRINDFEFGDFDFSPGVLLALSFLGNFLQQIFVGIGFFNLPITIGLTLLFGLMIIGYYRFH